MNDYARTPPQDIDAERSILGAMLLSRDAVEVCLETLTPEDFYRPQHGLVFDVVRAVHHDGEPVDAISVGDRLDRQGDIVRVGGQAYLHELIASVPTTANAGFYADLVVEKARLRKLIEVGTRVVQLGYADGMEDVGDIVQAARQELDGALVEASTDDTHETAIYDAIDSLDQPLGIPTPWREITRHLGGWVPGNLTVIGARPSIGKTVMGIGVLIDAARRGQCAMMFSLEMSKTQLYLRMLSDVGGVSGDAILHRSTTAKDDQRLAVAASSIAALPIVVDDRPAMSLAQIRARAKAEQRRRPVGMVVVDYLTLIKAPKGGRAQDRRVEVDDIVQGLKNMARELDVPVVALAQLNRGIEGRADKLPTMADFRESGGIEAAADNALLMHRDMVSDVADPRDLMVNIPKSRHGRTAVVHLDFDGEFSRISDAAGSPPLAVVGGSSMSDNRYGRS